MLVRHGDLVVNKLGNPIALIKECEQCILINRAFWRHRGIRNRVSEIVGGSMRHEPMPEEIYREIAEREAERIAAKGWL